MDDPKITQVSKVRMEALRAASKVAASPHDLLKAAAGFEFYVHFGYHLGDIALRHGPAAALADPVQPASPAVATEPAASGLDRYIDAMECAAEADAPKH